MITRWAASADTGRVTAEGGGVGEGVPLAGALGVGVGDANRSPGSCVGVGCERFFGSVGAAQAATAIKAHAGRRRLT